MLGFGMIIPILPFYIQSFGASGKALGALMATYGLLQFIFAPLWGSLSDRIGRKPVLIIGVLGNALSQILFGLSTQLWMLFVARAMSGVLSSATLPTAMAYIGDSTTQEKRGGGMGIIGAAMGLGMVLGPGLGGILAKSSLALPFFIAGGLSLLALGLVFIFLPEPVRPPQPVGTIQTVNHTPSRLSGLRQALVGPLGMLFFLSFLVTFGLTNFEGIFGLYAAEVYKYDPQHVGFLLMVVGLVSAVMQGAVTGPATRRFGEQQIILYSLIGTALGFVFLTQARGIFQILPAMIFFVSSNAMLNPSVASLISKRTNEGQGITMGLNNSFLSLGRIAGPLWAGFAFDMHINLPYLTGALIMLAGFGISLSKFKKD